MQAGENDNSDPSRANIPATSPARRWWSRGVLVAVLVLGVVGFYALGLNRYFSWDHVRAHLGIWKAQAEEHRLAAVAIFFAVYAAAAALSLPVAGVLSLTGGALFGRWLALVVVDLAATVGATGAFLASRYLFRDAVVRHFGPRLRALDEGVERNGAWYLLSLRLVPLVPFFLINLGMGLTRMRARTFAAVSLVGMLPGAFLYTNAGEALRNIASPRDVLSPEVLVALALVGLVPLALRLLVRHWQRRKE
jgi:uncharacterized membrane protein YdjX (TVP38/TMEM64 family)